MFAIFVALWLVVWVFAIFVALWLVWVFAIFVALWLVWVFAIFVALWLVWVFAIFVALWLPFFCTNLAYGVCGVRYDLAAAAADASSTSAADNSSRLAATTTTMAMSVGDKSATAAPGTNRSASDAFGGVAGAGCSIPESVFIRCFLVVAVALEQCDAPGLLAGPAPGATLGRLKPGLEPGRPLGPSDRSGLGSAADAGCKIHPGVGIHCVHVALEKCDPDSDLALDWDPGSDTYSRRCREGQATTSRSRYSLRSPGSVNRRSGVAPAMRSATDFSGL